jgi:hypothetical protein
VRALSWLLFSLSAWAQPATVFAGTTGERAALACVRSVGVGTASHCGVGDSGLGAPLASVRKVVLGSGSHCGGGYNRLGRSSGICSIGQREFSHPLCWRIRQVRALLWPQFASSCCSQPATVVEGTTVDGATLASVRLVCVGSASHCRGGHDR